MENNCGIFVVKNCTLLISWTSFGLGIYVKNVFLDYGWITTVLKIQVWIWIVKYMTVRSSLTSSLVQNPHASAVTAPVGRKNDKIPFAHIRPQTAIKCRWNQSNNCAPENNFRNVFLSCKNSSSEVKHSRGSR